MVNNDRLSYAVEEGNLTVVKVILDYEELDNLQGYILLRSALMKGHSEIATRLLQKGCKVNRSNRHTDTALHFATSSTDLVNVKLLLQKEANVHATNAYGDTPLHCACRRRMPASAGVVLGCYNYATTTGVVRYSSHAAREIVKLLVNKNANVNCRNSRGDTPLHTAVGSGNLQAAEMLLNYGSNINSVSDKGETPLHKASACCYAEASVRLLLQKGANINAQDKEGKTALYYAVKNGCSDIVQLILSFSPDVNQDCNRCLVSIAVLGTGKVSQYTTIIENLFQHGFSVTNENVTDEVFYAAIAKGHLKVVEELLKLDAYVDRLANKAKVCGEDAKKSLIRAVENHQKNIVQLLLQYQVFKDIVKESSEVVNCAVDQEDSEMVKLLLQYDANINPSEKGSLPALYFAARRGHLEICEMLLIKGADISFLKPKVEGWSYGGFDLLPDRHRAEARCQLPSYSTILRRRRHPGTTALHVAAENGHGKVVELLLKFGADIDCINDDGHTALTLASQEGDFKTIEILLYSGSDINGIDSKSIFKCFRQGNLECVDHPGYCLDKDITITLSIHIRKMMCAGLFVQPAYLKILVYALCSEDLLNFLSQEFKAEIDVMKTEKILSTCNTTFFDVLTRSLNQLAPLFKNDAFVLVLSSDDLQKKFPSYAGLIACNSKKAKLRAMLLEKATMFFHIHMPFLPHICTDEILFNLVNKDLEALYCAASP